MLLSDVCRIHRA